jgi:hypothetical protein
VAAAERAANLDQIGSYAGLVAAVSRLAAAGREGATVPDEAWEALAGAVGPGPLAAVVVGLRA